MKSLLSVVCALVLQSTLAHADRSGYYSSTQGRLTVVKDFSVSTTKADERMAESISLKAGATYGFEIGNGSYYKSTLCDMLFYCTDRWEKDPSYFMRFSLLKTDASGLKSAYKTVQFHTRAER